MNAWHITVYGRVQGVFFRASTKEQADRIQLKGYVKNQSDGSVFIHAEGEADQVNTLIEWIKQGGPPMGRVEHYTMEETRVEAFIDFTIGR